MRNDKAINSITVKNEDLRSFVFLFSFSWRLWWSWRWLWRRRWCCYSVAISSIVRPAWMKQMSFTQRDLICNAGANVVLSIISWWHLECYCSGEMYAMHFLNFQTRVSKYVSICQMLLCDSWNIEITAIIKQKNEEKNTKSCIETHSFLLYALFIVCKEKQIKF